MGTAQLSRQRQVKKPLLFPFEVLFDIFQSLNWWCIITQLHSSLSLVECEWVWVFVDTEREIRLICSQENPQRARKQNREVALWSGWKHISLFAFKITFCQKGRDTFGQVATHFTFHTVQSDDEGKILNLMKPKLQITLPPFNNKKDSSNNFFLEDAFYL